MSVKIVTTFGGKEVERSLCRYIQGEYYLIGDTTIKDSGECYLINDRYCRDTDYIVYEETKGEYVIANSNIVEGVIEITKDGSIVKGHFTKNDVYNVQMSLGGNVYIVKNREIMESNRRYRYSVEADMYYERGAIPATNFARLAYVDHDIKYGLPYNCDGLITNFTNSFSKSDIVISEQTKKLAPHLKDLTFGWEFESVKGKVPLNICKSLGLITLRDGSISGLEYASIPFQGEKGIEATNLICNQLSRHTAYDNNCSLHLHIGNMPRTKEFLVALFKMLCTVQDEVFEMFPIYKKYNYGVKRKNYTKPLPAIELLSKFDKTIDSKNIDSNFDELFKFLSMGSTMSNYGSNDLKDVTHHPSDPRGSSKWNIRTRYHWVNLIPILFGNKQTVEFRIHTPTTDEDKVKPYLFVCAAIINYVKENTETILQGKNVSNLNDIIYEVYSKNSTLVNRLCAYIKQRKRAIYHETSQGNLTGDEEAISGTKLLSSRSSSGASSRISGLEASISEYLVSYGATQSYRSGS